MSETVLDTKITNLCPKPQITYFSRETNRYLPCRVNNVLIKVNSGRRGHIGIVDLEA